MPDRELTRLLDELEAELDLGRGTQGGSYRAAATRIRVSA